MFSINRIIFKPQLCHINLAITWSILLGLSLRFSHNTSLLFNYLEILILRTYNLLMIFKNFQPTFPFSSDVITVDSFSLFGVEVDKMANISSVAA